jgi:DNA-directed RNA polymerase subunit F
MSKSYHIKVKLEYSQKGLRTYLGDLPATKEDIKLVFKKNAKEFTWEEVIKINEIIDIDKVESIYYEDN